MVDWESKKQRHPRSNSLQICNCLQKQSCTTLLRPHLHHAHETGWPAGRRAWHQIAGPPSKKLCRTFLTESFWTSLLLYRKRMSLEILLRFCGIFPGSCWHFYVALPLSYIKLIITNLLNGKMLAIATSVRLKNFVTVVTQVVLA